MPAVDAPRVATAAVTERYGPPNDPKGGNPNVVKLRAVVAMFGLSPTEVGRAVGTSRCYVSRILSQQDEFVGSDIFWRKLEGRLGELVANRRTQFFHVNAVAVEDAGVCGYRGCRMC